MPSELERRLAMAEQAAADRPKPLDDDPDLDDALAAMGWTRDWLRQWEIPGKPDATLSEKFFDAMVFQLVGCHRPTGPDPVESERQNGPGEN